MIPGPSLTYRQWAPPNFPPLGNKMAPIGKILCLEQSYATFAWQLCAIFFNFWSPNTIAADQIHQMNNKCLSVHFNVDYKLTWSTMTSSSWATLRVQYGFIFLTKRQITLEMNSVRKQLQISTYGCARAILLFLIVFVLEEVAFLVQSLLTFTVLLHLSAQWFRSLGRLGTLFFIVSCTQTENYNTSS